MSPEEKLLYMKAAVKPITDMLQNRMNIRIDALKAFEPNSLENLPDEVKKMREMEASRLRAVIQEQRDLIETIKAMYPDA